MKKKINCRMGYFILVSLLFPAIAVGQDQGYTERISLQLQWKHQFEFAGFYAATSIIKSNLKNSVPGGPASSGIDSKIIALTASAFEEDRVKVLEHGCDDFMRKPFQEHEIFKMLSKHLGVQFIHETTSDDKNNKPGMSTSMMQQAIVGLPKELKCDFKTAVDRVDFDRAIVMLERLQEENEALASALAENINGYQFDILQKLFEGVK